MNKKIIIFIIIALVVGVSTYISLDNYIYAIGVFAIYMVASIALFVPQLNRYEKSIRKYHECYHFINNFIISLSIKKSIKGALESTVASMPQSFIDIYEGLENMSDREKLNYLSSYFTFHVYHLFSHLLNLWEEEGGDILKSSKYLVGELRSNEDYLSKTEALAKKKYVEVGVLWLFAIVIVIILRFALKDFYGFIVKQYIYVGGVLLLMTIILFSIYLLIIKGTKIQIKGYAENEKKF